MSKNMPLWSKLREAGEIESRGVLHIPAKSAGVYVWRRSVERTPECIIDSEQFVEWVEGAVAQPYFRVKNAVVKNVNSGSKTIRPNLLRLNEVILGGGLLTETKRRTLQAVAKSTCKRKITYNVLLRTMREMQPTLYVGETDDIRTRIYQHSRRTSDFRLRIAGMTLEFDSLQYQYMMLPDCTAAERKLIEQALTHMLIAPLTFRAG